MPTSFEQIPADMPITFVIGDQLDIGLAVTTQAVPANSPPKPVDVAAALSWAQMALEDGDVDQLDIGLAVTTQDVPPVPVNLTGYTLEAKVFVPQFANPDGGLGAGGYTIGTTAATFTISPVSLSGGTVSLGLTEAQTAELSAATGYRWYFRWTDTAGATRTVVSGTFTARIP